MTKPLTVIAAFLLLLPAAPTATAAPVPPDHHEEGDAPVARPAAARGTPDRLTLKDGRVLEGRITAEDDRAFALKQDGLLRVVRKEDVESLERGTPPAPAPRTEPAPDEPRSSTDRPRRDTPAKARRTDRPVPPLGERARAWAEACIVRLGDEDEAVRRSAAQALVGLGPSVRPVLEAAAEKATDKRLRANLGRVMALVDRAPKPDARDAAGGLAGLQRLPERLGLDGPRTEAYGRAMRSYLQGVRPLLEDLRAGVLTVDEARTRAADLRAELRTALAADLTEEQLAAVEKVLDKMARRIGAGPAPAKKPARKPKTRKDEPEGEPPVDG